MVTIKNKESYEKGGQKYKNTYLLVNKILESNKWQKNPLK